MTTRWLTTAAEFAALAPVWDRALEQSGSDNPFLLSDFLLAWSAAFAAEGQLRILVCFDGDHLVGGLPLYRTLRRHGRGRFSAAWPALRYAGLGFANFTEPFFTGAPEAFSAACAAALRRLPGWRYLSLPQARAPLLTAGAEAGLIQLARVTASDGRIRLEAGRYAQRYPNAAAYVATLRPRMQANLRRSHQRAEAAGGARIERVTDPAAIEDLIAFQLRHNGPDRYPPDLEVGASRAQWATFTRELLELLARTGRLDAMALFIGAGDRSQLAAAGFGFRHGGGYKSLLISHDPGFRALGPGFLFFYHLIDWCIQQGEPYLDMFADGNSFEKRRWCNEFVPLHTVWVFDRSLSGRALYYGSRLWFR